MLLTGYLTSQIHAEYAPFAYLHDDTRGDCQSKYEYFYKNIHQNQTIRAQYGVTMLLRSDSEHHNSLLFSFANYENATKHLTPYPVRVFFDKNGKIIKIDVHVKDTDASVSTKKAVLLTTQLEWKQVTNAINKKGPLTFKSLLKGKTKECNIEYHVKGDSTSTFDVEGHRNVTECTGSKHKDYDMYKDSTKVWKFAFDTSKESNFQTLSIDIVDYFAPDHVVTIASEFTFMGCEKYQGNWDTNDLVEDTRDYNILHELRKQHKNN